MFHSRRPVRFCLVSRQRVRLWIEELETRLTPATAHGTFAPVVMAGAAQGSPVDTPAQRVDANTTASQYSGVGSVQVTTRFGAFIGTGTVLAHQDANATYVLTAGHVVDVNGDGKFTSRDGVTRITFWLNYGGNQTHAFTLTGTAMYSAVTVNPFYTGFNRPSVNDDLAVLRFDSTTPAGVKAYPLYSGSLQDRVITMVGYGQSGYGDAGYTVGPSWFVKRVGRNVVDDFYGQDDAGQLAAKEVFRFDFDGPSAAKNVLGGPTLGNDIETTLGGGDSGGPSFVSIDGKSYIAGVNTYTQSFKFSPPAPRFGSLGGGIVVGAYTPWLEAVVPGVVEADEEDADGGGEGEGSGDEVDSLLDESVRAAALAVIEISRAQLLVPVRVVFIVPPTIRTDATITSHASTPGINTSSLVFLAGYPSAGLDEIEEPAAEAEQPQRQVRPVRPVRPETPPRATPPQQNNENNETPPAPGNDEAPPTQESTFLFDGGAVSEIAAFDLKSIESLAGAASILLGASLPCSQAQRRKNGTSDKVLALAAP